MLTLLNTSCKGIASEARRTATDGVMVDNLTPGVDAAGARARVCALLVDTGSVLGAVGADQALRPARGRSANVVGLARARGVVVDCATHAILTAGGGHARVLG